MIRRNHIFMDALYQGTPRNIIAMTVNMNGVGSKFFNVTRCQARCDKVVGIKLPYLHKSNELPQKKYKKSCKIRQLFIPLRWLSEEGAENASK